MRLIVNSTKDSFNLILELVRIFFAVMILFFHVLQHSYDMTDDPIMKFQLFADWFFVISGFVLFPYYKKVFIDVETKPSTYYLFVRRRLKRMWPMLFIGIMLSTLLWAFQSFMKYRYGIPYNVMPERSILYTFFSLTFLQVFIPNSFYILPNLWAMCVEFYVNLIFMAKFLIKKNRGVVLLIFLGFLTLFLGYLFKLYIPRLTYGSSGLPAVGRAIIGFGIGFIIRANEDFFLKFFSRRNFLLITLLMFIGFIWPKIPGHFDRVWMDLIFGIFLLFLVNYDIKRGTWLSFFAEKGGSLTYGFYVIQGVSLDFVDYVLDKPRVFVEKYPESVFMIFTRFSLACIITLILAYFSENLIRKLFKTQPV